MTSHLQSRRIPTPTGRILVAAVWPAAAFRTGVMLAVALLAAGVAAGQQGQGRGKRSSDLRPCDEHWDHGRRVKARGCYLELISSNADPAAKAEAFWGLRNFNSMRSV